MTKLTVLTIFAALLMFALAPQVQADRPGSNADSTSQTAEILGISSVTRKLIWSSRSSPLVRGPRPDLE